MTQQEPLAQADERHAGKEQDNNGKGKSPQSRGFSERQQGDYDSSDDHRDPKMQ
jgi:hypothetical protein